MRRLDEIKGFGPARLKALGKRGVNDSNALVERLPKEYRDATHPMSPTQMTPGVTGCFEGWVDGKPMLHRARGMQWISATIADEYGCVRCMWFNQPWMKDKLYDTQRVTLYGSAVRKKTGTFVVNPSFEQRGSIVPVYESVPGIGQKMLRDAVRLLIEEYDEPDPLGKALRARFDLMEKRDALREAHFPTNMQMLARAKDSLAFEELLLFQMAVAGAAGERRTAQPLCIDDAWIEAFYDSLPYMPTDAQRRAVSDIVRDLRGDHAMARMVQGDVGCGKTMIALCAMYLCARAGGQSALMVPTEILANQHMESALRTLRPLNVTCGLLTGNMSTQERRRAREAIASGEWQAVIGTHALISEGVCFDNLRLVITDEQHRFGVRQRTRLEGFGIAPHVMVMSATPIPRTLSLVLYGDLDISVVDEMPAGRASVQTRIVPEEKRQGLYAFIRAKAAEGQQTYVVCPLVDEDAQGEQGLRSASQVYTELSHNLSPLRVGLLHGRMGKQEKEDVLHAFYTGEMDVLVATTVIEVGVNVPNATVMVVENAERFGLAQLHQLRGRVGRGNKESWCFLMSEPSDRLRTLVATQDGFAVAQKDLELRGAGEFFGTKQHGEPRLPAVALAGDGKLLIRTREAFLQLMRDQSLEHQRRILMATAQKRYERPDALFGRN